MLRLSPLRTLPLTHRSASCQDQASGRTLTQEQTKNQDESSEPSPVSHAGSEKKRFRRATLTGDWTDLKQGEQYTVPSTVRQLYSCSDTMLHQTDSKENLGLSSLLLRTCSPTKPAHHSPSDPGICMDSGSDEATVQTTPTGHNSSHSTLRSDSSHSVLRSKESSNSFQHGSDSAHSTSPSSSSSSCSSPSSSSSSSSFSLTCVEEAVSLTGLEEAISLAYIDESRTVHKYIASRGQREREEDIYEYRPPCLHITKKIEVVRA